MANDKTFGVTAGPLNTVKVLLAIYIVIGVSLWPMLAIVFNRPEWVVPILILTSFAAMSHIILNVKRILRRQNLHERRTT